MDGLYFKQLQLGPMENFVYVLGCERTRDCVIVDPAWEVDLLLEQLDKEDLNLVGTLVTHYHPDHCGGSMMGFTVEGLPQLMTKRPVPVWINEHEADGLKKVTGLSDSDLKKATSGDKVRVGDIEIELLHTPGHTPGSQCFRVGNGLVSGDTLFVEGCGRVDLPGGDSEEMYRTLTQRLAKLPNDIVLYPGHNYGHAAHAELGEVRETNHYLRVPNLEAWRSLMG
ncbi:MAG: hydroxyacylglutathione hydrolase [Myxococcota bacterium]|jgi:hydroxyacylglutathione hydrolase